MRNHEARYERMECGEGPTCEILETLLGIGKVAAPIIGGALGYAGAKEQASAMENAAKQQNQIPQAVLNAANQAFAQGAWAPPPDPMMLQGRESLLQYGQGTLPGLVENAQRSWLSGLNPMMNPYADMMVESTANDLLQRFQRDVLPSLGTQATGLGTYGGSRHHLAKGLAAEGLMESLADANAAIRGQAYRDALGQQANAWAQTGGMLGIGRMPSDIQREVGQARRTDLMAPAINAKGLASTLSGQQFVSAPYVNPWAGAAEGAGLGLGLARDIGNWFKPAAASSGGFNPNDPAQNPFDYM